MSNLVLAGFPVGGIIAIVIGVIIIICILGWWISTSNNFKRMQVKIDEALSGIDVALTKRYDLLTKAVATAKGYAKHESETLEKIIAMRNPGKNSSLSEKQEFANATTEAVKSLNIVAEQYPTLKADTQFTSIQRHIADVEEQLQAARRLYNSNVSAYNQAIIVFPASIIAKQSGCLKRDFFEAEASKREDVKIEF
jgi:LemA protein